MNTTLVETDNFEPISLNEMDSVALLNRTDTKYVLSKRDLRKVLSTITSNYRILEISGNRSANYKTLYFDTPDLLFYTKHHNGKSNRYKVRFRKYLDSELCFLEIKFKNNKGRTIKKRVKCAGFEEELSAESIAFIEKVMGEKVLLKAALWNTFSRITLVSKKDEERATIDLGLAFEFDGDFKSIADLAIIEVKQAKASRESFIVKSLKELHIRPGNMSKYAVGKVLLTEGLKKNNFKRKIIAINKITNGTN